MAVSSDKKVCVKERRYLAQFRAEKDKSISKNWTAQVPLVGCFPIFDSMKTTAIESEPFSTGRSEDEWEVCLHPRDGPVCNTLITHKKVS